MTSFVASHNHFRDSSDDGDDPYHLYGENEAVEVAVPSGKLQQHSMMQSRTDSTRVGGTNCVVLHPVLDSKHPSMTKPLSTMTDSQGNDLGSENERSFGRDKSTTASASFTSLFRAVGDGDTTSFLQSLSGLLLKFLSSAHRICGLLIAGLILFFFFPITSMIAAMFIVCIILGTFNKEDNSKSTTRTVKWTVTGFSQQMKDGFLVSPAFLDRTGQWRLVIKQRRGMDGIQTNFGLMCTDIFPEIELVSASISFYCTNHLGQEINTGAMRTHTIQEEFQRPGDCAFGRPVRLSRRHFGDREVITVHCSVKFKKRSATFLSSLVRNLRSDLGTGDVEDLDLFRTVSKKGKNVVVERGTVLPGDLEFHQDRSLPAVFQPVMRFVQHPETRTFIWEIPAFTSFLEGSEIWGLYSPQFFVFAHDTCSIWRMKLIEVQGVFRLHVQLRGLSRSVNQVKLWYLLQLVDMHGDSVIPEHAVSRVKYPDHMNLWNTTRHILYKRETMLERFIGENGALVLRISLQMQPNDVKLMEVDSDEWIQGPSFDRLQHRQSPALPNVSRSLGITPN